MEELKYNAALESFNIEGSFHKNARFDVMTVNIVAVEVTPPHQKID